MFKVFSFMYAHYSLQYMVTDEGIKHIEHWGGVMNFFLVREGGGVDGYATFHQFQ